MTAYDRDGNTVGIPDLIPYVSRVISEHEEDECKGGVEAVRRWLEAEGIRADREDIMDAIGRIDLLLSLKMMMEADE